MSTNGKIDLSISLPSSLICVLIGVLYSNEHEQTTVTHNQVGKYHKHNIEQEMEMEIVTCYTIPFI